MPRIQVGNISLNYIQHASGDNVVLAVHGNLGCAHWLDLATPLLPANIRVIAAEWRGCGDSDKPEPAADYSNYTMETHARGSRPARRTRYRENAMFTATRPAASSSRTC